jgi:hypothetical protein
MLLNDVSRYPEDNECAGDLVSFDPNDPESIRAAQERLRARFNLSTPPTLCSQAHSTRTSLLRRAFQYVTGR